jgi:hypothetical protein
MSTEQKIVAIARRHSKQFDTAKDLTELRAAWSNLEVVNEAAKLHNCEELATAVMMQDLIATPEKRDLIFSTLNDPLTFLQRCKDIVEQHKDYLK